MLSIFASIAPVFILIIIGHLVRHRLISDLNFWQVADKLVYWILMPALLFYHTSTIHVDGAIFEKYAITILTGFLSVITLSLIFSKLFKFSNKATSSVLQGASRHNSFIVLAIAGKLFGAEGLALATLAMAILIPATNTVVVSIMVALLQKPNHETKKLLSTVKAVLINLVKNPILLSITLGLLFSLLHGSKIFILHDVVKLLGGGALPIILLVIGANTKLKQISADKMPVIVASVIKLLVFPVILFIVGQFIGLDKTQVTVLVLFGAVPTAVSSYTLASQMGGDAKLMNTIITLQTLFSFISIPLIISFLQNYTG